MSIENNKLQQYQNYIDRLQSMGKQIATYKCPTCQSEIKTQAAPAGEVWDTLSTCPHCDSLHLKFTKGATASAASMPDA